MADQNPMEEEDRQREFSLEIERDPTREIAEPSTDIVDLRAVLNQSRDAAQAEKSVSSGEKNSDRSESGDRESEEEKRRRRDQSETSKDADIEAEAPEHKTEPGAEEKEQAKEPVERQPDRTFPDDIQRGFYIRADHRGDQHVFADSQGKREVFQESGDKLRTKTNDAHAVKLMLDTAAHRGWSSINVKGSQEFRREAWLEGQARGIAVTGYKPTELDLQELKNREQAYLRNEIVQGDDRPITRDRAQPASVDANRAVKESQADRDGDPRRDEEPGAPNEHTRADRRSADYRDGIEGVLVEHGVRPYKDNPRNDPSPYIVLQDDRGDRHTAWGVGLPDAMLKAGARQGDYVRVREAGMETVTKNVLREVDGRTVRVPQEVERRAWDAEVLQEREASRTQMEQEDQARQSPDDRLGSENAANREVARTVSSAERTLHVGPGRDAALEDGAYANEARAKEYMATGRIAAGRTPELKNAASLEAYVERKVRQKYPNDPVVVQRAMQTARTKIGHAVARGYDFPQPRVVEMKEIDQARQDRDQQQGTGQKGPEQDRRENPEQNREQNKNQSRSR